MIKTENNTYEGIDAVIDKDFATSLLAEQIDAESLIITTGVPQVCVNFGTPEQKALEEVTAAEMLVYAEQGHFPAGSMQPKIEASLSFLKKRDAELSLPIRKI